MAVSHASQPYFSSCACALGRGVGARKNTAGLRDYVAVCLAVPYGIDT